MKFQRMNIESLKIEFMTSLHASNKLLLLFLVTFKYMPSLCMLFMLAVFTGSSQSLHFLCMPKSL